MGIELRTRAGSWTASRRPERARRRRLVGQQTGSKRPKTTSWRNAGLRYSTTEKPH